MNFSRLAWLPLVLLMAGAVRAEPVAITLASGSEIISQRHAAPGKFLVLWLTGQYGPGEEEEKAAATMASRGVETWLSDVFAPYFLPWLASSWEQIPTQDMGDWLETVARRNPGKRILLIADGHGATLALRAAHEFQSRHPDVPGLAGALLMWPLLYRELEPGEEPDYHPVVGQTRLNLIILQPKSSAGYWWRERLKSKLEEAGSRVWLNVLPGLRDGFYRRGDTTPGENAAGDRLGEILLDALAPLLDKDKP